MKTIAQLMSGLFGLLVFAWFAVEVVLASRKCRRCGGWCENERECDERTGL